MSNYIFWFFNELIRSEYLAFGNAALKKQIDVIWKDTILQKVWKIFSEVRFMGLDHTQDPGMICRDLRKDIKKTAAPEIFLFIHID